MCLLWLALTSGESNVCTHLHQDVLHHLAAVVVHADVTGEGFPEEDISGGAEKSVQVSSRSSRNKTVLLTQSSAVR